MEEAILRIIEFYKDKTGEYPDLNMLLLDMPYGVDKTEVRKTLEEFVNKGKLVIVGGKYEFPSVKEIAEEPLTMESRTEVIEPHEYPEVRIDEITERELTICPYETQNRNYGGGHKWIDRRWNPKTCKWYDFCPKCKINRSFNTVGYVKLRKGPLIYEYNLWLRKI